MIKKGILKTLAEVGKIKTGYKGEMIESKGGKKFQPPKKLDHFIITTTIRDTKTGNLVENTALMDKLPKNPEGKLTEIKIRLPFDTIDKNFFTEYQCYSAGKRVCSGDGEKAIRRGDIVVNDKSLSIKGDEKKEIACDAETCPIAQAGKCKVSGILSAFLPEAGDLGGVYKFRTHSFNAVSSILGSLEFFAANTGGILQGLPLKLVMLKKTTEDHGNICYATVVLDGEEMAGLRKLAIEEKQARISIGYDMAKVEESAVRSGFFDDKDSPDEVEAEFYADDDETPASKIKGTSGESLADLVAKAGGNVETVAPKVETQPSGTNPNPPKPASAKTEPAKPAATEKKESTETGNANAGNTGSQLDIF
jgi:hypothetical protein